MKIIGIEHRDKQYMELPTGRMMAMSARKVMRSDLSRLLATSNEIYFAIMRASKWR